LIVAIGVLNTVLMTVLERTREYGVMRALGTGRSLVFRLIVYEVALMALIGLVIGFGLSLLINHHLSIHGIAMSHPYRYGGMEFTHFYTEINTRSFYIPAITVLFSALFVSIFPALRAAHISPARALRTH
jgi:putative ABC transport system permease protein